MNEVDWLKAAAGSQPVPPDVDVTADVMRTLRDMRTTPQSTTPTWLVVAFASWGLAIASVVVAQQALTAWQDPLAVLLRF